MIVPSYFTDFIIPVFPDNRGGIIDAGGHGIAIPLKNSFRLFLGFYDQTGNFAGTPGSTTAHAQVGAAIAHGAITTRTEAEFLSGTPHAVLEFNSIALTVAGETKISIWHDNSGSVDPSATIQRVATIKVFDSGLS